MDFFFFHFLLSELLSVDQKLNSGLQADNVALILVTGLGGNASDIAPRPAFWGNQNKVFLKDADHRKSNYYLYARKGYKLLTLLATQNEIWKLNHNEHNGEFHSVLRHCSFC